MSDDQENIPETQKKGEADDYLRFRLGSALKCDYKLLCYLMDCSMSDRIRGLIEKDLKDHDLEQLLAKKIADEREAKMKRDPIPV